MGGVVISYCQGLNCHVYLKVFEVFSNVKSVIANNQHATFIYLEAYLRLDIYGERFRMQVSINYAVALWEFRMNCASGSLHTRYKIVNNMACALDVVPVKRGSIIGGRKFRKPSYFVPSKPQTAFVFF